MKTILSFALMAIIVGMIVMPAFADSKLDSLVNLATQARLQVKIQLDKMPSVSDEVKTLYDQGSQETELLASAAKQGDVAQAKQHFMSAMKIFKQISISFSDQTPPQVALKPTPSPDIPAVDYENAIKRIEVYTNKLKGQTAKNGLVVDFTRIDSLIQLSKTNLSSGDMPALEKTFAELKIAVTETQDTIKKMIAQITNDKAKDFANSYITKIDTILVQAKELGLSDENIAKLIKAKEEIASANDPNRIIVITRQYSINIIINDSSQQILTRTAKLDSRLGELEPYLDDTTRPKFNEAKGIVNALRSQQTTDDPVRMLKLLDSTVNEIQSYVQSKQAKPAVPEKAQTEEKRPAPEAAPPVEKSTSDSKEDRAKQKETAKNQKASAELARSSARLAEIQPYVDESIKPKFERAESLLSKLQNQETSSNSDYNRTVKMLNLLLDQMERYIKSSQSSDGTSSSEQVTPTREQTRNQESEEKRPSKQNQ